MVDHLKRCSRPDAPPLKAGARKSSVAPTADGGPKWKLGRIAPDHTSRKFGESLIAYKKRSMLRLAEQGATTLLPQSNAVTFRRPLLVNPHKRKTPRNSEATDIDPGFKKELEFLAQLVAAPNGDRFVPFFEAYKLDIARARKRAEARSQAQRIVKKSAA